MSNAFVAYWDRKAYERKLMERETAIINVAISDEDFLARWSIDDYEQRITVRSLRRWAIASASVVPDVDLCEWKRYSHAMLRHLMGDAPFELFSDIHRQEQAARLRICSGCSMPTRRPQPDHFIDAWCEACEVRHRSAPSSPPASGIRSALQRARSAGATATLTDAEWSATVSHFEDRCAYCGGPWCVVEHATPISCGGGTVAGNCLPACDSCNNTKGARSLEQVDRFRWEPGRVEAALRWLQQCGRDVQ